MTSDHDENERDPFRSSPTGPVVAPPRLAAPSPQAATPRPGRRRFTLSLGAVLMFVLLISNVGIRAYRDLSRPEAWSYWKDQYVSPSLTAVQIRSAPFGGADRGGNVLAITGEVGPAAATWFRERLERAGLAPGDTVLLASPGGDLEQALIIGEIIRAHGLSTAVGAVDAAGRITPSYCASACVLIYAGGKPRYGLEGSKLGVHRFVTTGPSRDPVAEAQKTTGMVLNYMSRMGVAATVVEAMTATRNVRWLDDSEAAAMNLVTTPVRKPSTAAR